MEPMKSLKELLEENKENRIDAIGTYIGNHINENWQTVLLKNQDKLQKAYIEAGDMAYGTFLNLLFLPIHRKFKEVGLHPEPNFPGDFDISREWGNIEENDQQRWMWSGIRSSKEGLLGTIVTIVFHDHTQFRVPRQPQIIVLNETDKEDVVAALSLLSSDFKQALEFSVEYEQYIRNQQS